MKKLLSALGIGFVLSFNAMAGDSSSTGPLEGNGVITIKSASTAEQTASKLETILNTKGMTIFNRIKHSEGAKKVGVDLRNTELFLFGNPKVGSPLMKCQQQIALDLPQKALIWEDDAGATWVSYNDPAYLKNRHAVEGCDQVFIKISKALAGILGGATK